MSWWDRIKGKLGDKSTSERESDPEQPKPKWLPASATPFGVPVLDLISVTGTYLSATRDPEQARRAVSWRTSVGDELDATVLESAPELPCSLRYPIDPLATDGLLFCPSEMEHKWVLALRGDQLLIAHSWTGELATLAQARREAGELVIESLRMYDDSGFDRVGDPIDIIDWLIRTHALGQNLPLPAHDEGAATLEANPLLAMSLFGYMARCAATSWNPPAPARPLRTDGRLLQAVRAEDLDAVRQLAEAGEPIDAPSPTQGYRPLGVAVIKNDPVLVELLLRLGADPNLGDDRGMAPLGRVIVHGGDEAMLDMLVAAGARTDVVNIDGFGLLHAVAETNRAELISWMLAHGVALELQTKHGHTPLHIACALGHVAAAEALLDVGADPNARADGKDALAIATEREQLEIVALLTSRI
jgi:ankyrin repeat protein